MHLILLISSMNYILALLYETYCSSLLPAAKVFVANLRRFIKFVVKF